ncbi:MAG TPA: cysteine dioxygenase family protein [Flavobacteriales bacterium]|nr:cysteine dioxygenase family protein [Flavobacteriales bacterium]
MPRETVPTSLAPITSIGELIRELLREQDVSQYGEILARYGFPTTDLMPYLRWNQRHYTRTCVVRNEKFELLVICYEPEQRTSIHDYDSASAWIITLMGEVVEDRFQRERDGSIRLKQASRLTAGATVELTRENSIHRFANPGPARAITLNLYAPPMSQWRVYDERTGAAHVREAGPPR